MEEDGSVGEGTGDGKGENELRRISFFFHGQREERGRAQGKRDMREGKRDRCNETEKRTVGPRERKRETERAEGIEKTQRKGKECKRAREKGRDICKAVVRGSYREGWGGGEGRKKLPDPIYGQR